MRFKNVNIFVLLCLGCITFSIMSCKEEKKNLQVEVSFKNEGDLTIYKASTDSIIKKVDIEIADSEYEIQTGLMYRSSMKNNQGMLFIFPDVPNLIKSVVLFICVLRDFSIKSFPEVADEINC